MRLSKVWIHSYILIQILILAAIKWCEYAMPYSVTGKVMYTSIVLNACMVCLCIGLHHGLQSIRALNKEERLICMALMLTLLADFFLTLRDSHYVLGVGLFCLVQTLYALRVGQVKKSLPLRILFFVLFSAVLRYFGVAPLVLITEAYSIAMLASNVIFSVKRASKTGYSKDILLAAGLTLFMGCDLCVGLRNALWGARMFPGLSSICDFWIWIFYVPGQMLITLSFISEDRARSE